MAKFVQREFSVRFVEVYDELVKKKLVGSMKDFCKRMDYVPQNMSLVKSGKRDVTIDLIIKLFYEFGGNPVYVLFGLGDEKIIERDSVPAIPKKTVSLDNDAKLIKRLEDLVDSKIEIIALLKKEVERLTIELGTKTK